MTLFEKTLFVTQQERGYCHHCILFFFPNNMVFREWKQSSHFLLSFPFLTLPQTEADIQKQTDALKLRCRKWRWRDCPLRLLHYPFLLCSLFILFILVLVRPLCGFFSPNALLLPAFFSGVYIYFLSSVSCLLSSFHPSLISLPSSRTRQRQRSVSRQRT